jgi:uridine kinase
MPQPIVIGIGGGSGAGKSTIVRGVAAAFPPPDVVVIEHDAHYRHQVHLSLEERGRLNFDHPEAFETPLLVYHLGELKDGRAADIPVYDYTTLRTPVCRSSAISSRRRWY